MGAFNIGSPTIGGGSAFLALLNDAMAITAQDQGARAGAGLDLFGMIMQQELEARRRGGISLVDQLLLGQEFGTTMPLSQLPPERAAAFGIRDTNPLLGDLTGLIAGYSGGALPRGNVREVFRTPQGLMALVATPGGAVELVPVGEGTGLQTVQGRTGPLTVSREDVTNLMAGQERSLDTFLKQHPNVSRNQAETYLQAVSRGSLSAQQRLQDILRSRPAGSRDADVIRFLQLPGGKQKKLAKAQTGGSLIVSPGAKKTGGSVAKGPVTFVDASGQPVAQAGEGGGDEMITITPAGQAEQMLPSFGQLGGNTLADIYKTAQGIPPAQSMTQQLQALTRTEPRDVLFRIQELLNKAPGMSIDQALDIARRPGAFMDWLGQSPDPRQQAAWLLGGNLARDLRFTDPFLKALSLGRAPTPSELTSRDVSLLPPELRASLQSLVGEELWPSWLFELAALSPAGTNTRAGAVGGLRV